MDGPSGPEPPTRGGNRPCQPLLAGDSCERRLVRPARLAHLRAEAKPRCGMKWGAAAWPFQPEVGMVRPARLERATSWFVVAAEPNALAPTECYRLRFTPKTARFAPCASATISHGVVPRGGTNWGTANRTIDGYSGQRPCLDSPSGASPARVRERLAPVRLRPPSHLAWPCSTARVQIVRPFPLELAG